MIDIRLLNDPARQRLYKAGQRIAPSGGAPELYVVVSGRVDRYAVTPRNTLRATGSFSAGSAFGYAEFFGAGESVFRAAEDTFVFVVTEQSFDSLASGQPRVAFELLRQACARDARQSADADSVNCTPQNYNAEVAARARDAFREKYKGKLSAVAPQSAGASAPGAYPSAVFPDGYQGYPGVTHPEYTGFLYPAEYKCPNCGQGFSGQKVFASKLVPSGPVRYDLRKTFNRFDTAWYDVLVCPYCYFSMFADYFTDAKALGRQKLEAPLARARQEYVFSFDAERTLDFVFAAHFLAVQCTDACLGRPQLLMRLWANVSWLFEGAGDETLMRTAARNSARASESIYKEGGRLSPVQEQILCLSTAGMLYRAGESKDDVRKWLLIVRQTKNGKKTNIDLAESLLDLMRE